MKNVKKFLTLFIVCFLLAQIIPFNKTALSDAGPIVLYGVNIRPYKETNVALVKENLEITMGGKAEEERSIAFFVNVRFYLKNEGDKTTVKTGFPFGLGREFHLGNLMQGHDVKVKVNGKEIPVKHIKTESSIYDPWVYFDLNFAKGEEKVLDVSYTELCSGGLFVYILKTGGYWKGGKIGEFNMKIKFPGPPIPPLVLSVTPKGYKIEGNALVYRFTDYAPDQNVEITFIPPDLYKRIKPAQEKALKSDDPKAWFEYALSLIPNGNPFGPYLKNYLGGPAKDDFKRFAKDVFDKAISLQKRDSFYYDALVAIRYARFEDDNDNFTYGLPCCGTNAYYLIDEIHYILTKDVKTPQTEEQGRIFAAFYEYRFLYDFSNKEAFNSVKDFRTFIHLAEKYAANDPKLFVAFNYGDGDFVIGVKRNFNAPPFEKCFIPDVVTGKNYFELRYALPVGAATAVTGDDFRVTDAVAMLKGEGVECSFPHILNGFAVRFTFNSEDGKSFESALKDAEKTISAYAFDNGGRGNSYRCALVNAYFSKIANNLEFAKDSGVSFKNKEIDCTEELEEDSDDLKKEILFVKSKKGALKKLNLTELVYKPFLWYLNDSEKLIESAKENPKIKFFKEGKEKSNSKNNDWKVLSFALLAACIALFAFVIFLSVRLREAVKK